MRLKLQSTADGVRLRLLEGILLRLARSRHADLFVLRGGMLLRHWFRPFTRYPSDVDLVCTAPFDIKATAARLLSLLANDAVADGIEFDAERYRIQGIWLNTNFPGVRMFATGTFENQVRQFTVDVSFAEPLVPSPRLCEYALSEHFADQQPIRLWMCRPETIIGRKLHAIWDMGITQWRPKDLSDIRFILKSQPTEPDALAAAIATSFTSRGDKASDAKRVFADDAWWQLKTTSARWHDFLCKTKVPVPEELQLVVDEVAGQLQPILEQLE